MPGLKPGPISEASATAKTEADSLLHPSEQSSPGTPDSGMTTKESLLALGEFDEGVGGGAADHLVEGGAGGDHGIDAVLLLDLEVDEVWLAAGAGAGDGGDDFGALFDVRAGDAVGGGEGDEVRREDGRAGVVLVVEDLLPLADHAEEAVVDDGDVDGDLLLLDGGELGGGHLEAAVAGDDPDILFGAGELGPDGGGQGEAHGAEAAGGDERARRVVAEVLRLPHLVLADVGDDDGLGEAAGGLGFAPDVVDDVRGVEVAVVGEVDDVADAGVALHGCDLAEPFGGFATAHLICRFATPHLRRR